MTVRSVLFFFFFFFFFLHVFIMIRRIGVYAALMAIVVCSVGDEGNDGSCTVSWDGLSKGSESVKCGSFLKDIEHASVFPFII